MKQALFAGLVFSIIGAVTSGRLCAQTTDDATAAPAPASIDLSLESPPTPETEAIGDDALNRVLNSQDSTANAENNSIGDEPKRTTDLPFRAPPSLVDEFLKTETQPAPEESVLESTASTVAKSDEPAELVANSARPIVADSSSATTAPSLSHADVIRRDRIRSVLGYYYQRPENASLRSPWGIMHGMIAYGVDAKVFAQGRRVSSVSYLCWNGPGRGMRLFSLRDGKIAPRVGPGYQGHEGQFLAMMAQCRVPADYPMNINGKQLSLHDLIEYEKATCRPNTELTFKLIALSHYLPSDETWRSNDGQQWSIERLIQEDMKQPVIGAACGGTHRMMGFGYCVDKRVSRGEEIFGQWQRASKYTDDFHNYAINLQNRDGSFSTKWFEGRGFSPDIDRRMQTTGHILEWLVYTLPESQLRDPRVVRAVDYLTNLMWSNRNNKWEVGPKGHALRALVLYDQRVYGGKMGVGVADHLADYQIKSDNLPRTLNARVDDAKPSRGGLRRFRKQ